MSKKRVKILPTKPIHEWQHLARTKGWPSDEIAIVAKLIEMPDRRGGVIKTVVEVTRSSVLVMSVGQYLFDRMVDGKLVEDRVPYVHHREWEYLPPSEAVHIEGTGEPWCPLHGVDCVPDKGGCGARDVVHLVPCDCPWKIGRWGRIELQIVHTSACELLVIDRTTGPFADPPPPIDFDVPTYKTPVDPSIRPKKSNGWFLPGQSKLKL